MEYREFVNNKIKRTGRTRLDLLLDPCSRKQYNINYVLGTKLWEEQEHYDYGILIANSYLKTIPNYKQYVYESCHSNEHIITFCCKDTNTLYLVFKGSYKINVNPSPSIDLLKSCINKVQSLIDDGYNIVALGNQSQICIAIAVYNPDITSYIFNLSASRDMLTIITTYTNIRCLAKDKYCLQSRTTKN